jgi:hypothetical protein
LWIEKNDFYGLENIAVGPAEGTRGVCDIGFTNRLEAVAADFPNFEGGDGIGLVAAAPGRRPRRDRVAPGVNFETK